MRVAVAARGSGSQKSSEVRGATLSSTTTERGCDGKCGEWQVEVAKLGSNSQQLQCDGECGEQ